MTPKPRTKPLREWWLVVCDLTDVSADRQLFNTLHAAETYRGKLLFPEHWSIVHVREVPPVPTPKKPKRKR